MDHKLQAAILRTRRRERARAFASALTGPRWLAAARSLLRRWQEMQARAELNALDDRLLRDIGLRREDIGCAAAPSRCRSG